MSRRIASLSIGFPFILVVLASTVVFLCRSKHAHGALVTPGHDIVAAASTPPTRAVLKLPPARPQPEARPSASGDGMAMGPPDVIDGSKEPKLIPDVVAYRLWFVAVALPPSATDAQQARQEAQLIAAGLKGQDIVQAANILATFKTSYDYLIGSYNDSVAEANKMGEAPDLQSFLGQRDALVETTRNALNGTLSAAGMQALEKYVQSQKADMRVAKGDK